MYMGVEDDREPRRGGLQLSSAIFKVKLRPIALKLSQNIAKSMESVVWRFPARWLPVQANQWHSLDTGALMNV